MLLQEQVLVEKNLQSNSKTFHLLVDWSCLLPYTRKSKAYYHVTYNEPPKKIYYLWCDEQTAWYHERKRCVNFIFGRRSPDINWYLNWYLNWKQKIRINFWTFCTNNWGFPTTIKLHLWIYKRFLDSGISDLLVSAGVIVEGLVEQAFRGKRHRRGLQCIKLRRALIQKRLSIVLENEYL